MGLISKNQVYMFDLLEKSLNFGKYWKHLE